MCECSNIEGDNPSDKTERKIKMNTITKNGHSITIYTASEIAKYHDDHIDDLPESAVGYIEVSVEPETDYDFDLVAASAKKLISEQFGRGYTIPGVSEGDDFANNSGTSDEAESGMWSLIAVIPAE